MTTTKTTVEVHLAFFLELHGEEAWKTEIKRLTKDAIKTSPTHEAFWKNLTKDYAWLDWASLRQEVFSESPSPVMDQEQIMSDLLRKQMPGIKTQAQYNAVLGALDSVRLTLNSILTGDKTREAEGRKALNMAFEVTAKATEVTNKLEEVPEAATSKDAEVFKQPPAQFHEYDTHNRLLAEMEALADLEALNAWYASTKDRRDKVVSQGLRNSLMDAIRAKKTALQ